MPNQPAPPPFDIPPDLKPVYANLVRIAHTPAELIMDFARLLPGDSAGIVQSRLIMSPIGAKMFFHALAENLARYESSFGPIQIPGNATLADQLFGGLHPPDKPEKPE